MGPYIRKHLKRAGWRGGRLFTDDAALAIHGWTGGIPADVSTLCERLLVAAADCGVESIDASFVDLYSEDLEKAEQEEEPWNFDEEFGEFENGSESASELAAQNTEGLLAAPAVEPAANSANEAAFQSNGNRDSGDPQSLTPSEIEGLRHREEQNRVASQKAALPTGIVGAKHAGPAQPLETTLEHFESLELLEAARAKTHNGKTDPEAEPLEENGASEQEGFDPNAHINSETSAQLDALEQVLSESRSPDEYHEIRGGFLTQRTKPIVFGAIAAAIAGLALTFLFASPNAEDESSANAESPSMLGQPIKPSEVTTPETKAIVQLQNNPQQESQPPVSELQRDGAASPSDDRIARVEPNPKDSSQAVIERPDVTRSNQSRTEGKGDAENLKEALEDSQPAALSPGEIDLSENQNR